MSESSLPARTMSGLEAPLAAGLKPVMMSLPWPELPPKAMYRSVTEALSLSGTQAASEVFVWIQLLLEQGDVFVICAVT